MKKRVKLGVNIDHIATLRQARCEGFPVLTKAAKEAISGGADSIVAHLREDRRHIQDKDIFDIRKITPRFDMEMAATPEMIRIALKVKPDIITLVPEKRRELTTEGGLDVAGQLNKMKQAVKKLRSKKIQVSMFIDPIAKQIKASRDSGATHIEIHTGKYANSGSKKDLKNIVKAARYAKSLGLRVNAGHGLNYNNVKPILRITEIEELNIGFSIIARCVFKGLRSAVADMKKLLLLLVIPVFFNQIAFSETLEAFVPSEAMPSTQGEYIYQEISKPKRLFPDVKPDHWAIKYVQDVVKRGAMQGYPDGTYRGNKIITNYEMAVIVARMANAKEMKSAENDKIFAELASEVQKLRNSVDTYKRPMSPKRPFFGLFQARLRIGNVVSANSASSIINAPLGPVFDYRLIANYQHWFSQSAYLRFGIDTMDASITPGREIGKEMFEMEGNVTNKNGFGINVTSGPGLVVHRESTPIIFPGDDNTVYLRPSNGVKVYFEPGPWETGIGYKVSESNAFGTPVVHNPYTYIGYGFNDTFIGPLKVKYTIDHFTDDLRGKVSTAESTVNEYEFFVSPSQNLSIGIKGAVRGGAYSQHNMYAGLNVLTKELLRPGSSIDLFANKIGTDFFDHPVNRGVLGINQFNKTFLNATYDVGLTITQSVSKGFSFKMISDIVTGPNGFYGKDDPGSALNFELDMDWGYNESAVITFAYRIYQDPSLNSNATSDMIGFGFKYKY